MLRRPLLHTNTRPCNRVLLNQRVVVFCAKKRLASLVLFIVCGTKKQTKALSCSSFVGRKNKQSVQFNIWYLCSRKSPYALHPVYKQTNKQRQQQFHHVHMQLGRTGLHARKRSIKHVLCTAKNKQTTTKTGNFLKILRQETPPAFVVPQTL